MLCFPNCPICFGQLMEMKYLCKPAPIIDKKRFSYIEFRCEKPDHNFFQMSSLYKDTLVQMVSFIEEKIGIEINYVLKKSAIFHLNIEEDISDIIEVDHTLILNYQSPHKIINKLKNYYMLA